MTTTPANSKATVNTSEEVDTFDRAEVSRLVSMIRHELSTLATDAVRKRPLFSKSQKEARARRDASAKALEEFIEHIQFLKNQ